MIQLHMRKIRIYRVLTWHNPQERALGFADMPFAVLGIRGLGAISILIIPVNLLRRVYCWHLYRPQNAKHAQIHVR